MSNKEGIAMTVAFVRATTLVDGGWNITFTVDESSADTIARLTKMRGILLTIAVVPNEDNQ